MVTQLIYMSQPFGFDSAILSAILTTARRRNPLHGVTGALICRADDRHLDVTLLSRIETPARVFPDWAMLHDPAHSWLWSPEDVGRGAVRAAGPAALQQVFARAAADNPAS